MLGGFLTKPKLSEFGYFVALQFTIFRGGKFEFWELRTFEDSYNLAEPEPEPVLDLVILNFIPVPAEVEPGMDPQNVEAILPSEPQPVPLVPDPGAQNIEGGGNNIEAPPLPRVPPNIKLDPNLPGVNLNITVAE